MLRKFLTASYNKKFLLSGSLLLIVAFLLVARFGNSVLASFGSWDDSSLIHACKDSRGRVILVGPSDSCNQNETQVTWLKDVDAGSGLSINRSSGGATLSLASGVVSSSDFMAYQVNSADDQTTSSTSYVDMTDGTQQITLSKKSIVQVNAQTNAFVAPLSVSFLDDKTSNNNDLTNNNGVAEVTSDLPFAASQGAADLEMSSSQYLSITDASQTGLDLAGNTTLEAWIKIESFSSGFQSIIAKDVSDSRGYNFYYSSSTLGLIIGGTLKDVSWSPSTGSWYHVAVVYTTSGTADFYVNGSQQGSQQTGLPTSIPNSAASFGVGRNGFGDNHDGQIDDVRVWNIARTSTQITDNRSIELTGSESGLVAYYPLENTSNLAYTRTTYDSGGADTEIGKQGYTNVTTDGQSISAGGVVILDPGTYTIAMQKRVSSSGGTATYKQPGMSIVVVPTQ